MSNPSDGPRRASGETPGNEVANEESVSNEKLAGEGKDGDIDRTKTFRTPGFSRMRVDWSGDDAPIVANAKSAVEGRIIRNFADAYEVLNDIYEIIRVSELDRDGSIKQDHFGFTIWAKKPNGSFDEDFTRLTQRQKEDFLFRITTRLFDWEMRAADAWGEAMLAKAQWEEKFAIGYASMVDLTSKSTVEDRTQHGRLDSRDERYLAIFFSWYSRRADAIVRVMTLLSQRLKDTWSGS